MMMMNSNAALILMTLMLALSQLSMIKGTVDFVAKANPGFLQIEGTGGIVDGLKAKIDKDGILSGTFLMNLKDLKTGIEQRDGHMQGYLESDKFPVAAFKLNPIQVAGGSRKAFTGALTLHGVTRPVNGLVQLSSTSAIAKFSVDVSEYGINVPTYKLLTVGKDVEVQVTLTLQ